MSIGRVLDPKVVTKDVIMSHCHSRRIEGKAQVTKRVPSLVDAGSGNQTPEVASANVSNYPHLVRILPFGHGESSHSVKKEKSNLVGCSQLEVGIESSGVEMTIK